MHVIFRILLFLFLPLCFAVLLVEESHACMVFCKNLLTSQIDQQVLESLDSSSAVFQGKVLREYECTSDGCRADFSVTKSWKGVETNLVTVFMKSEGESCGHKGPFGKGGDYIVIGDTQLNSCPEVAINLCNFIDPSRLDDLSRAKLVSKLGSIAELQLNTLSTFEKAQCGYLLPYSRGLILIGAIILIIVALLVLLRKRRVGEG